MADTKFPPDAKADALVPPAGQDTQRVAPHSLTPPSAAATEALRASLVGYRISIDELKVGIRHYVQELRDAGTPIEKVIPAVRQFLQDNLPPYAEPMDGPLKNGWAVIERAVLWAIEEFYGDVPPDTAELAGPPEV